MPTSSRPAAPPAERIEALTEACGQRVGDRRVRIPRKGRGLVSRVGGTIRRLLTSSR